WTPPERRARPSPDARSDGRSVASTGRARYTDELRIRESFQCAKDGSLAQLVEQRTFNPLVGGSNPPRPTRHRGVGSASSPFFFFARLARRRVAVGRRRTVPIRLSRARSIRIECESISSTAPAPPRATARGAHRAYRHCANFAGSRSVRR